MILARTGKGKEWIHLYLCDPRKNEECRKNACRICNFGSCVCKLTSKKEFALSRVRKIYTDYNEKGITRL